jgi:hypothetical protein
MLKHRFLFGLTGKMPNLLQFIGERTLRYFLGIYFWVAVPFVQMSYFFNCEIIELIGFNWLDFSVLGPGVHG